MHPQLRQLHIAWVNTCLIKIVFTQKKQGLKYGTVLLTNLPHISVVKSPYFDECSNVLDHNSRSVYHTPIISFKHGRILSRSGIGPFLGELETGLKIS